MTICDVCKDLNETTKQLAVHFTGQKEILIDLCDNCIKYADVNFLIIGINEIRKHKVK